MREKPAGFVVAALRIEELLAVSREEILSRVHLCLAGL